MPCPAFVENQALDAVQHQLEAYNARDIEAFMQWWADNCRYYEFPDRLLASGKDQIRDRHLERFKDTVLCGTLVSRMAVGDTVIDQEVVTRTFPDGKGEIDVIAIYQLFDGKIINAWFKFGTPRLYAERADRTDSAAAE